jgi:hypothetical protein
MLSGNYIPLDEVIERAYRESGREEIDWNDAVVWIGDCLDLIGIPGQYLDKITNGEEGMPEPLEVINYRVELPADFFQIIGIREFDLKVPLQKSFGIYTKSPTDNMPYDYNDNYATNDIRNYGYQINEHFIFTTFETGRLEIAYKAFPTDTRGLPLIPDNTKYKLALQNYICAKLARQEWVKDPNSSGKRAIFNDFEREANWYCGAAQTNGIMPDLNTMESIKNNWLRSIPKNDQFDNGFKYMNKAERRRIV